MYPIIIRELVNTNYSINVSCYSNIMCISGNLNKCTAVHYIIITLVSLYSQFPLDSQFCKQVKVFNTFNCNEFLQETVTHQKYCIYSFNMIKLIVEVPVENVYSLLELNNIYQRRSTNICKSSQDFCLFQISTFQSNILILFCLSL